MPAPAPAPLPALNPARAREDLGRGQQLPELWVQMGLPRDSGDNAVLASVNGRAPKSVYRNLMMSRIYQEHL